MSASKPAVIRMYGMLHTIRKKQGLPVRVEVQIPPEGKRASTIARELQLPLEKIEAVFCNHRTYPLDHVIKAGDRVAYVPCGIPGPHRYCLGIKQAGDKSTK